MSGPKSVSCSVGPAALAAAASAAGAASAAAAYAAKRAAAERAAERERRRIRREQLQARGAGLLRELARVAAQWREAERRYGEAFPAWPHGDAPPGSLESPDVDSLDALVGDFAERVAEARGEYARQSTLFGMRASLQAASRSHAAEARAAAGVAEEAPARQAEQEMRRCAEDVARLLGTLAAEASREDRVAVETRAEEAAAATGAARRKALLAQLRLDVQRANAAAGARRRVVEQVERWRGRLAGLEGPDARELDRDLLRLAGDGDPSAVPPGMAQRVENVVARAGDPAERDYALHVITTELENLGYVVETGFDTASAQAPDRLLRKPDMADDYHVSLRAEAGAPTLHARVVREADDADLEAQAPRSAERERTDRDVERGWCRDLAAALAAAERRGVHGRVASRHGAGEVPVSTIARLPAGTSPRTRRRRKRTTRLRSRVVR